uniref:DM5 domain-containing protein n=1 Tax=Steinernema glaseri TaxID=37863 RepID=A0A1I7XZG5_9BILA
MASFVIFFCTYFVGVWTYSSYVENVPQPTFSYGPPAPTPIRYNLVQSNPATNYLQIPVEPTANTQYMNYAPSVEQNTVPSIRILHTYFIPVGPPRVYYRRIPTSVARYNIIPNEHSENLVRNGTNTSSNLV